MPIYFSEIDYFGEDPDEFIEIAVPTGTNVSGWSVVHYDTFGDIYKTYTLGSVQATINGHDVYVVDDSNPAFDSGGDPVGLMFEDDALALVNGGGTVLQFVSWSGSTVTGDEGPANGMTSTMIGTAMNPGESLQSDDGGVTYYTQTSTNKGTIPACYARGTLIDTPKGSMAVQNLRQGDTVLTAEGQPRDIRWIWRHSQTFQRDDPAPPIRLKAGCLGPNSPQRDLVVSGQHRIAIGLPGQLPGFSPCLVPAKSLIDLPGVHVMTGRRSVQWWHLVCDDHALIRANGAVSETMLLGPAMYRAFTRQERRSLRVALGARFAFGTMPAVLTTLGVRQARTLLSQELLGTP